MRVLPIVAAILLLGFAPVALHGQASAPPSPQDSCRAFVRSFYVWYLQKEAEAGRKHLSTTDLMLKERPQAFDQELALRLKEDSEAQAKVKDDIVGLDFDPILGGQDTCQPYDFRKAVIQGNTCRVEIFAPQCGPKSDKPDVVPELIERNGKWVFVNFRYPRTGESDDLLTILRKLREDREKPAATAPR